MKFLRRHRVFTPLCLVIGLQFLLAPLNAQGWEPSSGPAEETYAALAKENWSAAYLAARDWLDVEPGDPAAFASMASVYLDQGAPAAAIEFARKGLSKAPTDDLRGQLLLVQALAHADVAEFPAAWNVYERILRELPAQNPAHSIAARARWSAWAQHMEGPARDLMLARITAVGSGRQRYFKALFALGEEVGLQGLREGFEVGDVPAESLQLGVAALLSRGWGTIEQDRDAGAALVKEVAVWLGAMESAGFDAISLQEHRAALGRLVSKLEASAGERSGDSPNAWDDGDDGHEERQTGEEPDKAYFEAEVKSAREQLQPASERLLVAQDLLANLQSWSEAGELPGPEPELAALRQRFMEMREDLSSILQPLEETAQGLEASRAQLGSMMQMDMSGQWAETYAALSAVVRDSAGLRQGLEELLWRGNAPWMHFLSGLARGARLAALHSATTPLDVLSASDEIWLSGDRVQEHWARRGEALLAMGLEEEACYALARSRMEMEFAGRDTSARALSAGETWLESRLQSASRLAQEVSGALDQRHFDAARALLRTALDGNPIDARVLYQAWRLSLATEHPTLAAAALRRYWVAGGQPGNELLEFMACAGNGADWELLASITSDGLLLEPESPDVWFYRMLAALALGHDTLFERCAGVLESSQYHALIPAARLAASVSLEHPDGVPEGWIEAVAETAGDAPEEQLWATWKTALANVMQERGERPLAALRRASLDPRIPALARAVASRLSREHQLRSNPAWLSLPLRAQDACVLPRPAAWSSNLVEQLAAGQRVLFTGRIDMRLLDQDSVVRLRGMLPDSQVYWSGPPTRSKLSFKPSLVELEQLAIDTGEASLSLAGGSILHLEHVRTGRGVLEVKGAARFSGGQLERSLTAHLGARLRLRDVLLTGPEWKVAGDVSLRSSYFAAPEPQVVVHGTGRLALDNVTLVSRRKVARDGVALTVKDSGKLRLFDSMLVGLRAGDLCLKGKGTHLTARNTTCFGSLELLHQDAPYTWDGEGLRLRPAPLPGAKVSDMAYDEASLRDKLAAAKPGELVGLSMQECVLTGGPLVVPEGVGIEGKRVKVDGVWYKPKIIIGGGVDRAIVGEHDGAILVSGCSFFVENKRKAMTGGLELLMADETPRTLLTKPAGLLLLEDCWVGAARSDGPYTSIELGGQASLVAHKLTMQDPAGETLQMERGAHAYLVDLRGSSLLSKGPGKIFASQVNVEALEVWGAGATCNAPRTKVVFKHGAGDSNDLELRRISIARSFRDQAWKELREAFLAKAPALSVVECAELSRDLSAEFVAIGKRAQTPVEETKADFSDFLYPYLQEHPKQAGAVLLKVDYDAFDFTAMKDRLSQAVQAEIKAFANVVLELGPEVSLAQNVESYEYLKSCPPGSSGYARAMRAFRSGKSVSSYKQQLANEPIVTADSFADQRQAEVVARMESYWARENAALHSFGSSSPDSNWTPSFQVKAWSGSSGGDWKPSADARAAQYRRDLNTQINRAMGGIR